MAHPRKPKAEITTAPVPAGAKDITRTTIERFQESGAQSEETAIAADNEDLDLDPDDDFEEELPPRSAIDLFFESFEATGDHSIYIIRKPDPMDRAFANPCSVTETTGELPFDETFTTKEAVELAVQSIYGGGRYQLQLRQGGKYVRAWTTIIADPRKRGTQPAQEVPPSFAAPAPPPQEPRKSVREELRELMEMFRDLEAMRGGPSAPPVPPAPPVQPANPLDTMRETFGLFSSLRGEMRDMMGDLVPATSGGERNWVDSAAILADKLRVGDFLLEIGRLVVAKATAPAAPAAAAGHTAAGMAQPPAALPPAASATAPTAEPASAIEVALLAALDVVVQSMIQDTDDSDGEAHRDASARALFGFVEANPLARPLLGQLLSQSSAALVQMLAEQKPEWALITKLSGAPDFVGDVKERVNELLAGKGASGAVEYPPLEAVETRVESSGTGRTGKAGEDKSARAEADTK